MYKGGKLVPTSLDLYLALEYCDQGVWGEGVKVPLQTSLRGVGGQGPSLDS